MCSINIQTLLEGKTYPQAGAELYDILVQKMDEPKIVLDMTGVSILPSMFLNMSIGKFIDNLPICVVNRRTCSPILNYEKEVARSITFSSSKYPLFNSQP